MKKLLMLSICLILSTFWASASHGEQTISIKGFAYSIEKPDIAHIFIKTSGVGKDYTDSEIAVKKNIDEIKNIVKTILGKDVSLLIIKTESKVKTKFGDGNYEEYFFKMAKAIKGDANEILSKNKEEEFISTKNIYFSTEEFSVKQLGELRNTLASKKLAFNEKQMYDFFSSFDLKKSYILYGLSDPNMYLEKLAKKSYENAKTKANHIVKATGKKLGKLTNIDKSCNNEIEGGIDISEANKLIGKQLGPVSSNQSQLPLKYRLKFTFEIK